MDAFAVRVSCDVLHFRHHSSSCPLASTPPQDRHAVLCRMGMTEGSAFRVYRARALD